ncbi:T7SS effector LXG polymorphic toxin [Streptococcus pluranimalium]|uniref:T7SS effector LXG polymorphic toxin n=1 Tax=Streptococcus TaxID=1301 RepID=UPI00147832FA
MGYKIKFDDITSLQISTQTTIGSWGESVSSLNTAMSGFINDPNLQGQAVTSIRTYLSEVHGMFLQTLINLMNDYSASLLLYKDGYYNIDSNNHAELPENTFTTLQSDLKTSRDHLKSQIELLNTARSKISDLVSYSGSSHTKTIQHYNFIINDIKTLDESIKQYESNHASHDLSAFKELLASTKALLAEYSNRPRTVATYQSGDIGRLTNIERFATAYEAVANHLSNNAERLQAAQERDQARFEALAAEERSKQGWIDLALGAVTIAVGLAAIVATAGAATPLVVGAGIVAGTGTVAYGASNVAEAGQDIYLGYKGDGKTLAINPIRDTLFMGNDKLYHQVGGLFTTTSAVMIPIGQTQSVTKGLAEFAIGEVGGFVGGQAGYHGTKLLGGSEADAQRANLVGGILGGFAASSAASRFSLNEVEVPNTPTYNREQILKNIEESRLARESSNFGKHLEVEKAIKQRVKLHDELERRISKFDYNTASKTQKGNYGEIRAYDDLLTPKRGETSIYDLRRVGRDIPESLDAKLERGIDGIYINESGVGSKVIIDEAKFNKSKLNPNTADGKQMSYEWIKNRIHEDDFANPEDYFKVKQAIDKGNYEAVLSKVDIDGNVSHVRLDMDSNIIGTWP